jgi:enolase
VKIDQIGTLTEAIEAIEEARAGRYATIVSSRPGDTTDDFIADFAVATGSGAMKSGAPGRGEAVAKYNQLLRIEEELGTKPDSPAREGSGAARPDLRRAAPSM